MPNYTIERIGTDYVVKVDDQRVMTFSSRRRAAQLVIEASELMNGAKGAAALPFTAAPAREISAIDLLDDQRIRARSSSDRAVGADPAINDA